MALRNDDREWVTAEIRKLLEPIYAEIKAMRPSGWQKWLNTLKEHGILAVNYTVIVALFGIVLVQWNAANNRLAEQKAFEASVNNRLGNIEAALPKSSPPPQDTTPAPEAPPPGVIVGDPKQSPDDQGQLALNEVIDRPIDELDLTPAAIQEISRKLVRVNPDAQGYWPTVLQFLQLASANLSPKVPPPGPPNITIARSSGMTLGGTIRDRIVLLDGGELLKGRFENSRIIFTDDPVRMQNVIFVDCVFEFRSDAQNPPPYIRQAARLLLASNLKSVEFGSP